MKLESLKNGKFSENVLSKASLAMLNGGGEVSSANGGDTYYYSRCGQNGELYDCKEVHHGSHTVYFEQARMFDGTTEDDYK